jgi:hypothetical protein
VRSQLELRPARVQVLKQVLVQVSAQQPVLVPALRQERQLVQAHFLLHLQLQSQFLLQQFHLREHESR